jgi:hypothetical protein
MISYDLISYAIAYYRRLGYQYVEVPWEVSEEIADITFPPKGYRRVFRRWKTPNGDLVGSGEQGFCP